MNGLILRYYCKNEGSKLIRLHLEEVKNKLASHTSLLMDLAMN
jgi:hypothetical protein